jgi:hypothetical protein
MRAVLDTLVFAAGFRENQEHNAEGLELLLGS